MPKRVQVNKHLIEFPDDMSTDAIKFILHQNMGKLSDTQYHMDRDPFYQKASEQSGTQEPPASISRQIGVTPKFTDSGYYQFPNKIAPRRAPFRGDDQQPHEFKDYRIEAIPKPTIQTAIPEGAEIKAQDVGVFGRKSQTGRDKTLGEIISYIKDAPDIKERTNRLRESIGRFVAPLVGLDYDEQAASNVLKQMVVFHGSPHVFDKFDVSKIGTGEGAQAFGHGLYFAENPAVAKGYQKHLVGSTSASEEELKRYFVPGDVVPSYGGGRDQVIRFNEGTASNPWTVTVRAMKKQGADWVPDPNAPMRTHFTAPRHQELISKLGERTGGGLYQADIPDELTSKMLHWDKPFSQQSPEVQKALGKLGFEGNKYYVGGDKLFPSSGPYFNRAEAEAVAKGRTIHASEPDVLIGSDIYHTLSKRLGSDEAASKALHDAGLPGIRYFDQGSRAAGEGTHNIVVFNPDILENVTRK